MRWTSFFSPDGAPHGYDDLAPLAKQRRVLANDARALVVTVTTWKHLKTASGRAKDLEHLDRFYRGSRE